MSSPLSAGEYRNRWFWRCLVIVGTISLILIALRSAISYRALEIGLSVGWIGPLAAAFNLVPLVLTVPAGRWMDKGLHRPAAVVSSVLFLGSVTAFVWSNSLWLLMLCSLVAGACSLVLISATQAMIAMYSPKHKYDSRFSALSLVGSAGQVLGGGIVGIMPTVFATDSSATPIFAATAVASLLIVVLAPGVHDINYAADTSHDQTAHPVSTAAILRTPGVTPAIVASLTVLATVDLIGVYLPVLGVERGWSEATVGLLLALRGGATMVARVFLSRLSRWLGGDRLFLISVMASAVFVGIVAVPLPVVGAAVLLVVAGVMLGFGQPLSMALVARAAPEGARGMAMSLRMSGNMLGLALLPILTAPLAVTFGAGSVFFASAAALGGVSGMLAVAARTDPA